MATDAEIEAILGRAAQGGDLGARAELIGRLLPWVRMLAAKFARPLAGRTGGGLDVDDLVQEGVLELVKAVDRWNPSRTRLQTFAAQRVHGAFVDAIREKSTLIRGRRWMDQAQRARCCARSLHATRSTSADGVEIPLVDTLAGALPRLAIDDAEELARLCRLTGSRVHATVLERWAHGERLAAIGRSLGLSESRISQIRAEAIERLQQRFALRPLYS